MKSAFLVRLVVLNTFKKPLRASLVIGGIAITSGAMIVLFGISGGLRNLVTNEAGHSGSKDVVTVEQRNVQQIKLNQEKISKIQSISGVGQVESSVGLIGNLVYHGIDLSIPAYGVSKDYFSVSPFTFKAGDGNGLQGQNIVVSTKVLEVFGIDRQQAIGRLISAGITVTKDYSSQQSERTVTSQPNEFTITGVIDKGDVPVAYMPLETLRTSGVDSVSQLKVRIQVPERIPAVRESIEQMGFQTTSIKDTIEQINKLFRVIQKTLVVFGFIVFGITVSGTFTIISVTLMEEMKQIGFLRISGLKNRDVRVLFIIESILLTVLGAAFGVMAGIVCGELVNKLAQAAVSGEVFTRTVAVFAIPTPQIVMVLVLSVAIGWLVGVFPAKRAVLIKPLDELKL